MRIEGGHPGDRVRWVEYGVALLATLLVLADYAVFLAHVGALWRDEVNSVNLASTPTLFGMFRLAEFDSFPLLWTLALRAWMAIAGSGDGPLRVAGVLGGVSVVAALWIAARVTGRAAPVVSLAVVAAHPEILRWCATVRAFGPGTCAAVLALVAMIGVVQSPTRARVLLAVAATVCSVHLLFQNAVLVAVAVAGAMLAAVVAGHARRAWIPVAIGAAGAVSMLPYLGVIARVGEWSPLLATSVTTRGIVHELLETAGDASPVSVAVWVVFLIAVLVGGGWMLVRRDESQRAQGLAYAFMVIGAPVAFILFLVRLRYSTESWYYVGLLVFVAVCADVALRASFRGKAARLVTIVLAIVALAGGGPRVWSAMHERQTIMDEIAARLTSSSRPGDLVVLFPWFYALPLDRYYPGPAEVMTIPPLEDRGLHRYDLVKKRMLESDAMAPVLDRMGAVLTAGGRVWVVGTLTASQPGRSRPPLAPPPRPGTKWSVHPDLRSWAIDAGNFLHAHAGSMRMAYAPKAGVAPNERPTLVVAEGWRP